MNIDETLAMEFKPATIMAGQPTEVTLCMTNIGRSPLHNICLEIEFSEGLTLFSARRSVVIADLAPGATHAISLPVRAASIGTYHLTSPDISYRTSTAFNVHIPNLRLPLKARKAMDPPPRQAPSQPPDGDRATEIRTAMGPLLAVLQERHNPELDDKARQLRTALDQDDPDAKHITELRRYFEGQRRNVREAAAAFFRTRVVQEIINRATEHEYGDM